MLIGTLVVSLLLCVGLALAVLYVVAAPQLRASRNPRTVRLTARVDAGARRLGVLARTLAGRARASAVHAAEVAQRQLARRGAAEETGSARLHG